MAPGTKAFMVAALMAIVAACANQDASAPVAVTAQPTVAAEPVFTGKYN